MAHFGPPTPGLEMVAEMQKGVSDNTSIGGVRSQGWKFCFLCVFFFFFGGLEDQIKSSKRNKW